jgi:hypothetical protein
LYNNSSGNWRFADVQFDGTAVAPVPLPASVWIMLSGLGGFGFLFRRRSRLPASAWCGDVEDVDCGAARRASPAGRMALAAT